MLFIDGRQGEGGGQLLRSALAFSAITGRAFTVDHIRANRSKPGLKPQHLAGVRLAALMCGARCTGDTLGSSRLVFEPSKLQNGRNAMDIGTAGSITLLTQAVLMPALLCGGPVELELRGGTDVPMSPPLDFLAEVVLPYYRSLGRIDLEVSHRGFNPKGGGLVRLSIEGRVSSPPPYVDLQARARWSHPQGRAVVSEGLRSSSVAERMATSSGDPDVETIYVDTPSSGAVLTLWTENEAGQRMGVSRLGRRGVPAEALGHDASEALKFSTEHVHPVEEHLADQLIPLLAVCGGRIACQAVSEHTRTNVDICALFTGAVFSIEGDVVSATLASQG